MCTPVALFVIYVFFLLRFGDLWENSGSDARSVTDTVAQPNGPIHLIQNNLDQNNLIALENGIWYDHSAYDVFTQILKDNGQ